MTANVYFMTSNPKMIWPGAHRCAGGSYNLFFSALPNWSLVKANKSWIFRRIFLSCFLIVLILTEIRAQTVVSSGAFSEVSAASANLIDPVINCDMVSDPNGTTIKASGGLFARNIVSSAQTPTLQGTLFNPNSF